MSYLYIDCHLRICHVSELVGTSTDSTEQTIKAAHPNVFVTLTSLALPNDIFINFS